MNNQDPIAGTTNPYAPPSATVGDITSSTAQEPASRLIRLLAVIVDGIIVSLLIYGPLFTLGGLSNMMRASQSGTPNFFEMFAGPAGVGALVGAIVAAAINYVLVKRNSQTIAKKLFGIKVVRADGSHAPIGRIFALRNLPFWIAGLIPFINVIVSLVDSLMIFGEKKQCLHDRVADTIVVKA